MRFRKDEPSGWMSLAAATGAALAVGALCVPLLRALNGRTRTPVAAASAPDARAVAEPPSVSEQPQEYKRVSKQALGTKTKGQLKKHDQPKKHKKDRAKKPRKPGAKKRQSAR